MKNTPLGRDAPKEPAANGDVTNAYGTAVDIVDSVTHGDLAEKVDDAEDADEDEDRADERQDWDDEWDEESETGVGKPQPPKRKVTWEETQEDVQEFVQSDAWDGCEQDLDWDDQRRQNHDLGENEEEEAEEVEQDKEDLWDSEKDDDMGVDGEYVDEDGDEEDQVGKGENRWRRQEIRMHLKEQVGKESVSTSSGDGVREAQQSPRVADTESSDVDPGCGPDMTDWPTPPHHSQESDGEERRSLQELRADVNRLSHENRQLRLELGHAFFKVKKLERLGAEAVAATQTAQQARASEARSKKEVEEVKSLAARSAEFAKLDKADSVQQIASLERQVRESNDRETKLQKELSDATELATSATLRVEEASRDVERWRTQSAEMASRYKQAENRVQQLEQARLEDKAKLKTLSARVKEKEQEPTVVKTKGCKHVLPQKQSGSKSAESRLASLMRFVQHIRWSGTDAKNATRPTARTTRAAAERDEQESSRYAACEEVDTQLYVLSALVVLIMCLAVAKLVFK